MTIPTKEQLQAMIRKSPRENALKSYTVQIIDKEGLVLATRHVLACGKRRAELSGIKVNRYDFSDSRTREASAKLMEQIP